MWLESQDKHHNPSPHTHSFTHWRLSLTTHCVPGGHSSLGGEMFKPINSNRQSPEATGHGAEEHQLWSQRSLNPGSANVLFCDLGQVT